MTDFTPDSGTGPDSGAGSASLAHLRALQSQVVQLTAPGLPESGAKATPREGAILDGRTVSQRVQIELPSGQFDPNRLVAAIRDVFAHDDSAAAIIRQKADGQLRIDVSAADGTWHSITLLLGGRALQLTSFSALPEPARNSFGAALAGEPMPGEGDPRIAATDVEEELYGPDYGYTSVFGDLTESRS